MKKKLFLWLLTLIVILIYFPVEVYASNDLTRKEAETLYLAIYPLVKSPFPCYLYFKTGNKVITALGKALGNTMSESDEKMYTKLQELNFLDFRKVEGRKCSGEACYEIKVREETKNELTEVPKEEAEKLKLRGMGKWYKTKLLSLKFIGCSGVRNLKEKKEAIADFEIECLKQTKTFTTIAEVLKEILGEVSPFEVDRKWNNLRINLQEDWLGQILKDPKTKLTYQFTFDLYDDGWRLRKQRKDNL